MFAKKGKGLQHLKNFNPSQIEYCATCERSKGREGKGDTVSVIRYTKLQNKIGMKQHWKSPNNVVKLKELCTWRLTSEKSPVPSLNILYLSHVFPTVVIGDIFFLEKGDLGRRHLKSPRTTLHLCCFCKWLLVLMSQHSLSAKAASLVSTISMISAWKLAVFVTLSLFYPLVS